MKSLKLFFISLLISTATFAQSTSNVKLPPFQKVNIQGRFSVILQEGNEESIRIESEVMPIEEIEVKVEKEKLTVGKNRDIWRNLKDLDHDNDFEVYGKVKIWITFRKLDEVRLSGSGSVKIESPLNTDQLSLITSGSGKIIVKDANIKDLAVKTSGSGFIKIIQGKIQNQTIKVSGSGDIDMMGAESQNTTCQVSGSGNVTVKVKGRLTAKISGSGNISYVGKPTELSNRITGSGNIREIAERN
jgi:Putative auto-transporter adhesin, head GIN domain